MKTDAEMTETYGPDDGSRCWGCPNSIPHGKSPLPVCDDDTKSRAFCAAKGNTGGIHPNDSR